MKAQPSLADLIRNKEITFYSYDRKLDTTISRYGKDNGNLIQHLLKTAGNKIVVKGSGLENHLASTQNLYSLTSFLVEMQSSGVKKFPDHAIYVHADVEKLTQHYPPLKEEKIVNLAGQVVGDSSGWVPEMPYFEKLWNFALCRAHTESGYEYPRDENSFRYRIAEHAEKYMVGTKKQLRRYKQYALGALHKTTSLAEEFKDNPDLLFKEPYKLHDLEFGSRSARIIAENINHFSK